MWISGSVRWNLFLRSLCNVLLYSSCFVGFFPLLLPFLKNAMHTCLVTKPCQTLGDLRAYSPPGSSAGGQREESGPWQGHAEGSLTKRKDVSRFQGFPLEFPEHPPPQKSKNLPAFYSSIFSGKSQIRALVFCIWEGCFSSNPSDSFLACLTGSPGSLTACELLAAPNCERNKV